MKWLVGPALLLVAVGAIACSGDDDDETPTPTGATVEQGPLPGNIIFSANPEGNFDIFSMAAEEGVSTNLTNRPGDDLEPSVSADGATIAFQGSEGGQKNIYFMNPDGGGLEVYKPTPAVEGGLRFAPSGDGFAYYSFELDQQGLMWFGDRSGDNDYPLLDALHPSAPETDCAGGFPGDWISEDRILFRGARGDQGALQICAINKDKSGLELIFSQPDSLAFNPDLSPDGTLIAFAFQTEGSSGSDIYLVGPEGRNLTQVTSLEGNELNPSWSPDGRWIAFSGTEEGDAEIYVVRPDGTGLRKLTDNSYDDQEPYWSPAIEN